LHDLELYFLDYDNRGRAETVQIDNTSGTVLDTETISSFASGVYLNWQVSGNLVIKITETAGVNAVLNGLFIDGLVNGGTGGNNSPGDQGTSTNSPAIGTLNFADASNNDPIDGSRLPTSVLPVVSQTSGTSGGQSDPGLAGSGRGPVPAVPTARDDAFVLDLALEQVSENVRIEGSVMLAADPEITIAAIDGLMTDDAYPKNLRRTH
jgi:hypothetical protein